MPAPWTSCDAELPGERVHGQRVGAGRHRGRRAPAARDPHDRCSSRRSPCGSRSASAARPASRAARSRPCWPWRASAARPSAGSSSGGGSRPSPRRRRGVGVAAHARGAADGARVPRRPRALVGVHRPLDPAARGEAARPLRPPRTCGSRSPRRSTTRRWRSCTGSATARDTGATRTGTALDPPSAAPGRAVTKILDGDRLVAAIVHDAALQDDRAFIDTATSYALMTLDNHRLSAQTSSLLRAVRESRARIQAAADDERRRIERDLHDGAQQRLVALRIKLELAAERTSDGTRERRRGRRRAAPARRRRRGGARGGALARARHLSRVARRSRARRGAARGGAPQPAAHDGPRGRRPAPLARDRERRVLLLPGGAPERGQARGTARASR